MVTKNQKFQGDIMPRIFEDRDIWVLTAIAIIIVICLFVKLFISISGGFK